MWSKRFERELSDVFAIQDEIAAGILDEFRIRRDTPRRSAGHSTFPRTTRI